MLSHRKDLRNVAFIICALVPFRTTGRTCLKSPPKTTVFPPNGISGFSMMSLMLLSSASIAYLFVMVASSHNISDADRRSFAVPLCLVKLHTPPSCMLSGILNLECAVLPPGMMDAATPDVAVAIAIFPSLRTLASSALYRNVFPVPPGPSTKNTPPLSLSTDDNMLSYAYCCSQLRDDTAEACSWSTSIDLSSNISLTTPYMLSSESCISGRGNDVISLPIDCSIFLISINTICSTTCESLRVCWKSSDMASKCLSQSPRTSLGSQKTNIVANNLRRDEGI